MTKKELQALMPLIGAIRSASFEIKSYCSDYDSDTLLSTANSLDNALKEFRKEAKI